MVLKTFNVAEDVYENFSKFCKGLGINMSKQIEMFMRSFGENEPQARKEYLEKLEKVRKGEFVRVASFAGRYGLE